MTQELIERLRLLARGHKFDAVPVVTEAADALQSQSARIAEQDAGAELLFKRLEHLRDTSGTETRLERGNRAAYNSALELARASLNKDSTSGGVMRTEFFLEPDKRDPGYTIPMILHCPQCSARHIDEAEFAEVAHHTHACQGCGFVWRPAKVNTHGVRFLPGYSNKDSTSG